MASSTPARKRLRCVKLPIDPARLVPGPTGTGAVVLDPIPYWLEMEHEPALMTGLADPLVIEMLAADGLAALPGDARRQCMHCTSH